jgi:hypothetical protein
LALLLPNAGLNIAASCSYVVRPERVVIPRGTLDPSVLPPELLTLARAAFGPGVLAPAARPPAEAWLRALNKERSQVRICPSRPLHAYGSHLTSCPWCTRVATTGHDVFDGPAPPPLPDPPPREEERPGGGLRSALKVAVLVALVVVLAILAKQLGGG